MPYCQQFKNQITKWEKELEQARVLLVQYLENGEEEKVGEVREKIKEIFDDQNKFLEKSEYKNKIIEILKIWYPKTDKGKFVEKIKFDKYGRVIIDNDVSLYDCSISFFPDIIKKIKGNLSIEQAHIKTLNNLEEIEGYFLPMGSMFELALRLRVINGINLENVAFKNFQKAFPRLKKIGEYRGFSIYGNHQFKQELEQLQKDGLLKIDGEI